MGICSSEKRNMIEKVDISISYKKKSLINNIEVIEEYNEIKHIFNCNKIKKIIILIDDDIINLKILEKMVKRFNYDTLSFNNGESAVEYCILNNIQNLYGLIVDYDMKLYNGITTIKIIKKIYTNIKILGMSANEINLNIFKNETNYTYIKPVSLLNLKEFLKE